MVYDLLPGVNRRWEALPPLVKDVGLVLAITAAELVHLYSELVVHDCPCGLSFPAAAGIVLLTAVPLIWRRRAPFLVVNVVGPATLATTVFKVPLLLFGALVAVYTVSSLSSPAKRRIVLGILIVALLTNPFIEGDFEAIPEDLVTFGTAWVLGVLARTRRAYIGELERRAEQLQQEREDRARLAVAEERARIAREVHDVVAHSMSVMVVQTQAARSVLLRNPAKADESLEQVEDVGRRNLNHIRKLLGLLRRDEEEASFAPQPGLDQLRELLDYFHGMGLDVELKVKGQSRPVDSSVDMSAYRIVQESLTNVLKHSGSKRAEVMLCWDDRRLNIEVCNEGDGHPPQAKGNAGHGIVGMRERASLVGGTVEAGPRPSGGFRVVARLPIGETR
jgi:signal transduction histidine kinase